MSKQSLVCEHDRLARSCDVCLLTADIAEARATIRRLEMRLALATSRVTPWRDRWTEWPLRKAAYFVSIDNDPTIRLGDGTPEQEQT